MTPELAQAAIRFLERAHMQWQEVPAFQAVLQALHKEAQPASSPDEGD